MKDQQCLGFTVSGEIEEHEGGISVADLCRKPDCDACALKSRCHPKEPQRKVTRSIFEPSRDVARAIAQTTQYAISCKLRKKVEMLFAHLKRILRLGRL